MIINALLKGLHNVMLQESYLTPLMMCCCVGNDLVKTAQFLITKGASVDGYEQVQYLHVYPCSAVFTTQLFSYGQCVYTCVCV